MDATEQRNKRGRPAKPVLEARLITMWEYACLLGGRGQVANRARWWRREALKGRLPGAVRVGAEWRVDVTKSRLQGLL